MSRCIPTHIVLRYFLSVQNACDSDKTVFRVDNKQVIWLLVSTGPSQAVLEWFAFSIFIRPDLNKSNKTKQN